MKTIIAGSRNLTDIREVYRATNECGWTITEVVCGEARGADNLGKQWAQEHNIPVDSYPANWNKFGRSAGPIRNCEMADSADALVAIWDGFSKGTEHMITQARRKGLRIYVHMYDA